MRTGGTSGRGIHQTRSKTAQASEPKPNSKNHYNTLINFSLHGFNKHLHRFRCGGKGEHLNLAVRQNPIFNPLTTSTLRGFKRLCPWFRCQPGLEHRRMQIRLGGTSGRGIHQTCNRTAQASEPEQNSKNQQQFIEKLSIARFQQAPPPVQMQRQRGASEPEHKQQYGKNSYF